MNRFESALQSVSVDTARTIDRVCREFELGWSTPRIEDFHDRVPKEAQSLLTRELVALDVELRRGIGQFSTRDYCERFPNQTEEIRHAIAALGYHENSTAEDNRLETREIDHSEDPVESTHGSTSAQFRYERLREHARGGLGKVSVARDHELKRQVALKEIRDRHVSDPYKKLRFVREAEITGNLEHPGIVPVYSLGTMSNGFPFYTMRFVHGSSLASVVERLHESKKDPFNGLAFRRLLGQFVDVCQTLAFAHSRGVIHRDLKPENIMIGDHGETLVVDWGLAKVIDQAPISSNDAHANISSHLQTHDGDVIGTPVFMSPEQAAGNVAETGTPSDVYSLGVTLYCILTGRPPFDASDQVLEHVQDGAFQLPSRLKPGIPAALEAICLKAMSQKPKDRYSSADKLAEQIERWLADEPVEGYREPVTVRARRFVKRHRTAVTATAVGLLATFVATAVLAFVTSMSNAALTEANETIAEKNQELLTNNDQLESARAAVDSERRRARQVAAFVVDALKSPAPELDGPSVTVAQVMSQANEKLKSLNADPLTIAEIATAIGLTYEGIGLYQNALDPLQHALDICIEHLGEDDANTLSARWNLALVYTRLGRINDAKTLLPDVENIKEVSEAQTHTSSVSGRETLAGVLSLEGKHEDAIQCMENVIEELTRDLGEKDEHSLRAKINLGGYLVRAKRNDDAVKLLKSTLDVADEHLGPTHTSTLQAVNNLAAAYRGLGGVDDAMSLLENRIPDIEAVHGATHPHSLTAKANLGDCFYDAGRTKDAIQLLKQVGQTQLETNGPTHFANLESFIELSKLYLKESMFREMIEANKPIVEAGLRLPDEAFAIDLYLKLAELQAEAYWRTRDLDGAIRLKSHVLEIQKEHLGEVHESCLKTTDDLVAAMLQNGQVSDAILLANTELEKGEKLFGKDHAEIAGLRMTLVNCLWAEESFEQAEVQQAMLVDTYQRVYGESHETTLHAQGNLAAILAKQLKYTESLKLFEEIHDKSVREFGLKHPACLSLSQNIAQTHFVAKNYSNAKELFESLIKDFPHIKNQDPAKFSDWIKSTALCCLHMDDPKSAEDLLLDCIQLRKHDETQSWKIAQAQLWLGRAQFLQERLGEAQVNLTNAKRSLEKIATEVPSVSVKQLLNQATDFLTECNGKIESSDDVLPMQER